MNRSKKLDKENVEDILELTPVQEGMLFHYLNEPDSELYFEQLSFRISGNIDINLVKKAWAFVVEVNGMLRTVYRWEKLEKPVQVVLKKFDLFFREHDLSKYDEYKKKELLEQIKEEDRKEKINIELEPFRISLCELNENEYEMIISNYHIIYDGWSNGILLKEFLQAYNHYYTGRQPEKPEKTEYKEFIKWQGRQDVGKRRTFWENYLKVFESKTLLPVDRKKSRGGARADYYTSILDKELSNKARRFSLENNITVATLLYCAWGILLQKYNNCEDVVFGTTVSGRTPEVKGIEDVVGLFINTIPIRIKSSLHESLKDILTKSEEMIREREEFESTPLTDIKPYIELDGKDNIFDSIVVIENYPLDVALNSENNHLKITLQSIFEMTNYDLTLVISTFDNISLRFIYDKNIFDIQTIATLSKQYENILNAIIKRPEAYLEDVDVLCKEEKEHILFDFNRTDFSYPSDKTINGIFEEQVKNTPDNIAVIFEDRSLTYKQLNEKANQLARLLRKKGVNCETIVGIMMERSLDMAVSLIAILKAGGTYLPIDISLPIDRIQYMLDDSGAKILLTNSSRIKDIPYTSLQNFISNDKINIAVTNPRSHIKDFDSLPMPDRALININNYKDKIGMASVNNCISIQTTRGCPYKCLYCHKVWSKHHVRRSAENIFNEIEHYYKNGVKNFAVIDDCFNLDMENSRKVFELIINNKLEIQLFFPNGLRGDILTPDYIDLMVEAGTCGINLSLETASPRLQKLLKKNLDLDKFKYVVDYIATKHSGIILEMATMHGFPTETEEEALMTLNFIKDIKWLHFPYIHILKIFPNTEMEEFALEHGVSKDDILRSRNRAFHELPETIPFPKSFTRKYQASFMNDYFLSKERLKQVLPVQLRILDESALAQKYNAYLPVEIKTIRDLLNFTEIGDLSIPQQSLNHKKDTITIFDRKHIHRKPEEGAKKVLFLDLSQHFSSHSMLYKVAEQPIGQIYLLTYLKQVFGDKIDGRVYKAGNDFDSYTELKKLVDEYNPDLIGIRCLTYFKEFFHETVALLRQWGINVPIITGGPYASSDYDTILRDNNVDLVIFGEGEHTVSELIKRMLENDFRLPDEDTLRDINGIAYVAGDNKTNEDKIREVIVIDRLVDCIESESADNLEPITKGHNLAYVMYTSGSTGKPKGVMVEHEQVNNCIYWMQDEFKLKDGDVIVQRTNLTFDPSVWEMFWPLYIGASVRLITDEQGRDAGYLLKLMEQNDNISMMYCPASLISGMTYLINSAPVKPELKMPWLIIGAEPISVDTIKNFYPYFEGKIVNTYGPTECTINNTYYHIERECTISSIPIGKPVGNNRLYILSKAGKPMPLKAAGEIYIAGDSVARGYINNHEKTAENFIDNPFGAGKLYKTGDIGRWMEDGNIEILGRVDEQVKIRGYRIELGEIENAIKRDSAVEDCVVVVKGSINKADEARVCKSCGITTAYPGVSVDDDNNCNICKDFILYEKFFEKYFRSLEDLQELIEEKNKSKKSKYDCLLLYSGGRGSAHALYRLVDMGFNVLTMTYDNGYFSKSDKENIKTITAKLGVDHIFLKHDSTDLILKESVNIAQTVCRGCFHTSSSLALEYAYRNDINLVVGATLSRGQIIENKLIMFYKQGITEGVELEKEIKNIQISSPDIDRDIFKLIDIDVINDRSAYINVTSVDFYRYCDITNAEMIKYLEQKDSYWESRKKYAIYSTNCPIKQIGDCSHSSEKGFHYYGSATSWEKRLGHISLNNLKDDLNYTVSHKAVGNFLRRIGVEQQKQNEKIDTKYLCAYYVADKELPVQELKEDLSKQLPAYMIPSYFVKVDKIPLTINGKVDKKALPEPDKNYGNREEYVLPTNETEERIVEIWQKVLSIGQVGINDNFFDIGGNSILLIQMHAQIEKLYPGKVTMSDLFAYTTVAKLADVINRNEEGTRKDITIEPVEFPAEYFNKGTQSGTGSVMKAQLQGVLFDKIKNISKYEGLDIQDIMLGMYAYLISEVTNNKRIMVQSMLITNKVVQVEIDLNEIRGFSELFKITGIKSKADTEKSAYKLRDIEKLMKRSENPYIVPFIYNSNISSENVKLTDCFDMVLELGITSEKVEIIFDYDNKRLNNDKVKVFIEGYLELIAMLTEKYGINSEDKGSGKNINY